jgi:hypothetical protein
MAQSDILVPPPPPISDEENEFKALATCVTKQTKFQQTNMYNPHVHMSTNGQLMEVIIWSILKTIRINLVIS